MFRNSKVEAPSPSGHPERRAFLKLLAGAAISLPLLAASAALPVDILGTRASAQDTPWALYRRDDLGFQVEMPGTPQVEVEQDQDKAYLWERSIDAQVDFDNRISFSASFVEFRRPVSIERMISAERFTLQKVGAASVTETRFTINDLPGAELASEFLNGWTVRIVVAQNRGYVLTATGAPNNDPSVRRFLDSFKLLPVQQ